MALSKATSPVAVATSPRKPARESMTSISVKFTSKELELLASLASDQLFRREFIDPKMPGYKSNYADVSLGKALVVRLQTVLGRGRDARTNTSTRMVG
jgi:hypothetical protein